jgi:hypothetical protein
MDPEGDLYQALRLGGACCCFDAITGHEGFRRWNPDKNSWKGAWQGACARAQNDDCNCAAEQHIESAAPPFMLYCVQTSFYCREPSSKETTPFCYYAFIILKWWTWIRDWWQTVLELGQALPNLYVMLIWLVVPHISSNPWSPRALIGSAAAQGGTDGFIRNSSFWEFVDSQRNSVLGSRTNTL